MRIACIDNMNNNMFAYARLLRDMGHDAHLLLINQESDHFHPSADAFDLGYQAYTRSLPWGRPYDLDRYPAEQVRRDLKSYDALLGCGAAPAYAHRAGRRLDVFVPFGTDLMYYPFFRLVHPRRQLAWIRFVKSQMLGIRTARYVQLDRANDIYEAPLRRLGFQGERIAVGPPMIHLPTYSPDSLERFQDRTHWAAEFRALRERCYPLVFHQARHVWKTRTCLASLKANDRLVRGFAAFVKDRPSLNPGLVMIEYGPDVQRTRELVEELGIASYVHWFPKMTRKDLMIGLNMADIGTGEFQNSWLSCGVVYENLVLAKPLMHRRDDEFYHRWYPELYPMIDVKDVEEVRQSLNDFCERPDHYRRMGEAGKRWYERYVVQETVDACTRIFGLAESPAASCAA